MRGAAAGLETVVRAVRNIRLVPKDLAVLSITLFCLLPALVEIGPAVIGKPQWRGYLVPAPLFGFTDQIQPIRRTWWDRGFQTTFTAYFNTKVHLRSAFIRANNQLDDWILHTSRMAKGDIVVGRNNVLFEPAYIGEALGYAPQHSDAEIRRVGEQIKRLSAFLAQRGIPFIAFGTPGKVSFRRNDVPAWFPEFRPGAPRNYDRMTKIFAEMGVPFVDGRDAIRTSELAKLGPIYPDGGTHWTLLGAYIAVAKAVDALLHQRGGSAGGGLVLDGYGAVDTPFISDNDLLWLMNLTFPPHYPSSAPRFHLQGDPLPKQVALIGSSYGVQIAEILTRAHVGAGIKYFFYMSQLVPCNGCDPERMPQDWQSIILNDSSAVILELNETAFFVHVDGNDNYVDTLVDGLVPKN